jgi:hypothetical protein
VLAYRKYDVLRNVKTVKQRPSLEEEAVMRADDTSPEFGLNRTIRCLTRTVLPHPLGPITTVVVPFSTASETLSRTTLPPNFFVISRRTMTSSFVLPCVLSWLLSCFTVRFALPSDQTLE